MEGNTNQMSQISQSGSDNKDKNKKMFVIGGWTIVAIVLVGLVVYVAWQRLFEPGVPESRELTYEERQDALEYLREQSSAEGVGEPMARDEQLSALEFLRSLEEETK